MRPTCRGAKRAELLLLEDIFLKLSMSETGLLEFAPSNFSFLYSICEMCWSCYDGFSCFQN